MKWDFSELFSTEFWAQQFSKPHAFGNWYKKWTRIAVAAARGYIDDDCSLKASALTFYSLLSVVPVLAVAFGIARGFGFEKHLEFEIKHKLLEQQEVVQYLINFAYQMLENTQSGLIAGVGLVVLFYTVIKLLSNIESSFNSIWKVRQRRSLARSFSDYLAMMLFCPIFFAASSSISVFVVTQIVDISKTTGVWDTISPLLLLAFHIFPFILVWFLFTALYLIMPNTRVPLKYAIVGGICAGTAYQIVQAIYIQFQIGLASYGAIYGSFAALPLFLIWLQTSWMITLAGAEIAHHAESNRAIPSLSATLKCKEGDARVLGLLMMQECTRAFSQGTEPPSSYTLSTTTGAPVSAVKVILHELMQAGLLTEVNWQGKSGDYYYPGRDIQSITLKDICSALDTSRQDKYVLIQNDDVEFYQKALSDVDALVKDSPVNSSILTLMHASQKKEA